MKAQLKKILKRLGLYNAIYWFWYRKTIRKDFDAIYEASGIDMPYKTAVNTFLALRYKNGCGPVEFFWYKLYQPDGKHDYLMERRRRRICDKANSPEAYALFNDKIATAKCFAEFYKRRIYFYDSAISREENLRKYNEFTGALGGKFIIKPRRALKGQGIRVVSSQTERLEDVYRKIKTGNYIAEELLCQHPDMAALNPSSVNTLRVLTMKDRKGSRIAYCVVRIGRKGSVVDNACAGGIIAPVNLESCEICGPGKDYLLNTFAHHPDTGVALNGYKLPIEENAFSKFVLSLSDADTGANIIGWDIMVNAQGEYVMIEGNASAGSRIPQIAFEKNMKEAYEDWFSQRLSEEKAPAGHA